MATKSQAFLDARRRHLVAKLAITREATGREGLPLLPEARRYKEEEHIPQIIAAIERIDNGTYGYCLDCSDEIPEDRLLRHPHVLRCVPCQKAYENETKRRKTYGIQS